MLEIIATHLKDVSVLRRLLFAATNLPSDLPNVWGIAVEFATVGKVKRNAIDPDTAQSVMENIASFDKCALNKDDAFLKELINWIPKYGTKPLGVVLITSKKVCTFCKKELVLRKDRPSSITVYDKLCHWTCSWDSLLLNLLAKFALSHNTMVTIQLEEISQQCTMIQTGPHTSTSFHHLSQHFL